MVKRVIHIVASVLIPLMLVYSCANMGMPKGGPKDKLPPVIVKSIPEANQVNFKDNKVRITFNEFVVPMNLILNLSSRHQQPRSLSLKPKANNHRRPERKLKPTLPIPDFKDGIVDNNERNKYKICG